MPPSLLRYQSFLNAISTIAPLHGLSESVAKPFTWSDSQEETQRAPNRSLTHMNSNTYTVNVGNTIATALDGFENEFFQAASEVMSPKLDTVIRVRKRAGLKSYSDTLNDALVSMTPESLQTLVRLYRRIGRAKLGSVLPFYKPRIQMKLRTR